MADKVEIRTATSADLSTIYDFAHGEAWNPGPELAKYLFELIPQETVLVGETEGSKGKEVVACILCPTYGSQAWIGVYIVRSDWRGKGVGMKIWKHAEGLIGSVSALDGVMQQRENYKRSGYTLNPYSVVRHSAQAGKLVQKLKNACAVDSAAATNLGDLDGENRAYTVESCLSLDSEVHLAGLERGAFMRRWLEIGHTVIVPGSSAEASSDVQPAAGFGMIRRVAEGWRVGPLVASGLDYARSVLLALCQYAYSMDGESAMIYMDIPDVSVAAKDLANEVGLVGGFACARMVRGGESPLTNPAKLFGIVSWELSY